MLCGIAPRAPCRVSGFGQFNNGAELKVAYRLPAGVTVDGNDTDSYQRAVGERLRWAGDLEMPDCIRVDLSGRYRLTDAATLTLRVENLLDETTVEGLGSEEPGRCVIAGIGFRIF